MTLAQFTPKQPVLWTQVRLEGPDARDFLQRLTTVPARSLRVGQGQSGFFLTAQGRIRAYFKLWCVSQEEFLFEFDAGVDKKWQTNLLTAIDQFAFSEKMSVREQEASLECTWLFLSDVELNHHFPNIKTNPLTYWKNNLRFFFHEDRNFGKNWITGWGPKEALTKALFQLDPHPEKVDWPTLTKWRIQALAPWTDSEILEDVMPLEIGLGYAIPDNKGCYPGQEVIERIRSMGSPPRKLVRLQGSGLPPLPGTSLLSHDLSQEIGKITSSCSLAEDSFIALGLLRKSHAQENIPVKIRSEQKEAAHPREAIIQGILPNV